MSLWDAILQGIIQGLTEFLPVSSSGHLSLYQHFTGQSGEAAGLFSILLHLGTLAAVCIAFWDTIWGMIVEFFRMIGDIFKGKFTFRTTDPNRRMIFMIVVALLPLLVFFFLRDWYTSLATDDDILVEGLCFLGTAGLLYVADHLVPGKKTASNMRVRDALLVGTMQGIAPLPGLSRSGSTISAGIFAGLNREFAVAFSFILGIPAGGKYFRSEGRFGAGNANGAVADADRHGSSGSGRLFDHQAGALAGPVRKFQGVYLVYGDFRHGDGGDRRGGKISPLNLEEKQEF